MLGWAEEEEEEESRVNKYVSKVQREWDWEITECMSMSSIWYLTAPMHLGLKAGLLCPMSKQGNPEALLKLQMTPRLILGISSDSKEKEPIYACLSEAKASHSQRIWAEVFFPPPYISHTMDCPAVLVGRDAASECYDQ